MQKEKNKFLNGNSYHILVYFLSFAIPFTFILICFFTPHYIISLLSVLVGFVSLLLLKTYRIKIGAITDSERKTMEENERSKQKSSKNNS